MGHIWGPYGTHGASSSGEPCKPNLLFAGRRNQIKELSTSVNDNLVHILGMLSDFAWAPFLEYVI